MEALPDPWLDTDDPDGTEAAAAASRRRHLEIRAEVLEHLWKHFPHHCMALTDRGNRPAIDLGILRAARHGFREAGDVGLYVALMVMLGCSFDEDPQLPWAAEVLKETAGLKRQDAMGRLLAAAAGWLEPVAGRRGEHYRRSLAWVGARSLAVGGRTYGDLPDGPRRFLRDLHRPKLESLSEETVALLVERARASARTFGLSMPSGFLVYLGLIFLLGIGIDRDPFHPWVGEILWKPFPPGSRSKAGLLSKTEALHREALVQLRRFAVLDKLRGGG